MQQTKFIQISSLYEKGTVNFSFSNTKQPVLDAANKASCTPASGRWKLSGK